MQKYVSDFPHDRRPNLETSNLASIRCVSLLNFRACFTSCRADLVFRFFSGSNAIVMKNFRHSADTVRSPFDRCCGQSQAIRQA